MERREFLKQAGLALALALTPSLALATTVRGPDLRALAEGDPAVLATELRGRAAALRATTDGADGAFPLLRGWFGSRGHDPGLFGQLAATMWVSSTFRDLPARARTSPEVQRWLLDEAPAMAASMYEAVDLIDGLGADDRAELAAVMAEEPDLVDQLGEGFRAHGAARGVEPERLLQARALTDHLAWRLRSQSPDAVMDEVVDRFDRHCRRHGVDRARWREGLAAERPAWDALRPVADPDAAFGEGDAAVDAEVLPAARGGAHLGVALSPRGGAPEVLHVAPGSPAARAGLLPGDRITAVDGAPRSAVGLVGWLGGRAPGEVALTVARGREARETRVALAAGPGDRIVLDRPVREDRFPTTSAGLKVVGVGLTTMAVGGTAFVTGAVLLVAGGLESGIGAAGAVLTVLGLVVIALGGIVSLVGLIVHAARRRPPPPLEEIPAPAQ